MTQQLRDVIWVGTSKDDLMGFPPKVRRDMGYALYVAQLGDKHPRAKPLRGFGGAGVLEIVDDFDGEAYRTIYTVQLSTAIYVLHAFQKKATRGIVTPRREMEMVRARLRDAEALDLERRKRR